jgi:hypothetical protein
MENAGKSVRQKADADCGPSIVDSVTDGTIIGLVQRVNVGHGQCVSRTNVPAIPEPLSTAQFWSDGTDLPVCGCA